MSTRQAPGILLQHRLRMALLKEGGHTQANQSEEQSMLGCHLEADGERKRGEKNEVREREEDKMS